MPSQRLSRLILCGGFAAGLDLDSATAIGLLPAGIPVEQPGNTALAGAVMLAAHPELASAITDRFAGAEEVLLNHTADFEARFADALLLP